MSERIHMVVEGDEKERYRRQAARQGLSLSEWLRDAAREKLARAEIRSRMETVEELDAFFDACDQREDGPEPDWSVHRRVIEDSIRSGRAAVAGVDEDSGT